MAVLSFLSGDLSYIVYPIVGYGIKIDFPFSVLVFFNLVTRDTFYYNSFRRIVKTGKQKSNHIFGKVGMQPEHGNETGSGGR